MSSPLLGGGAVLAALLGAGALATAFLVPGGELQDDIWFDTPAPSGLAAPGDVAIMLHSSIDDATSLRVIVRRAETGATVAVVNTHQLTATYPQHPDSASKVLLRGAAVWHGAVAGEYTLASSALADGSWHDGPSETLTVTGVAAVPAAAATPTPTPTPTPTASPTASASAPTSAPTAVSTAVSTARPTAPAPPTPSPTPSARPVPPTGSITLVTTDPLQLRVSGVTPGTAIVDVQLQNRFDTKPADPNGSWSSLGCGDLRAQGGSNPVKYVCETEGAALPSNPFSSSWVWFRAVIDSDGGRTIVYGPHVLDPEQVH